MHTTDRRDFLKLIGSAALGDTTHAWLLSRSSGWYDLTLNVDGNSGLMRRFAGHLEDGDDSISDPLMGGLV